MIGLLRRRDFSLLWWGGLVSVAGDWTLMAVLPFVVYERTGSTVATAGMTVAELLPGILLGSVAGVFVDRWDRRRLLVAVNLLQAVVVLGLLLLAVDERFFVAVYGVAALQSALASFSLPAETSLLPTLVAADELVAANSLNLLNNRLGRFAGLPLGPFAYSVGGLGAVVAVDAASFLVAAGLVALMRTARRPRSTDAEVTGLRRFVGDWVDGALLVGRDRSIGVLFLVFGLMTFGGTMLDPLFAPWVHDVLHGSPAVFALLTGVGAASGIVGSLALGSLRSGPSPRLMCGWASIVAGALLLVRFNVPLLWVAVVLGAVSGMTSVASSAGVEALAQQRVPETYRGRVFGSLQATIWLMSLLGAVVGGVGATRLGVVGMLDVASVLVLLAGVVVLVALPARDPVAEASVGTGPAR